MREDGKILVLLEIVVGLHLISRVRSLAMKGHLCPVDCLNMYPCLGSRSRWGQLVFL